MASEPICLCGVEGIPAPDCPHHGNPNFQSAPRPVVRHISKMDDETLIKHMNARHVGAYGLRAFGKSRVPHDTDERMLRKMHDLHHEQHDPNHTHGEATQ